MAEMAEMAEMVEMAEMAEMAEMVEMAEKMKFSSAKTSASGRGRAGRAELGPARPPALKNVGHHRERDDRSHLTSHSNTAVRCNIERGFPYTNT